MLILNHSQVRELLKMRECMEVVGDALSGLARDEGVQPLRDGFLWPDSVNETVFDGHAVIT